MGKSVLGDRVSFSAGTSFRNQLHVEKQFVPSKDDPGFFVDSWSPFASERSRSLVPAAHACVQLKSETMAGVAKTCVQVKNILNEYYEALPNHPITALLNHPSSVYDSYQFWSLIFEIYYTHYNAYIRIRRDNNQNPVELIPVVLREYEYGTSGSRRRFIQKYKVSDITDSDHTRSVHPRNIIAFHGPGFDGFASPSPVTSAAMNALGIMKSATNHVRNDLENGINLRSVLISDKPEMAALEATQIKALINTVRESFTGAKSKGFVPVIPPGFTLKELTSLSNVDLQFIELMKWNLEDICRIWNVPPRMIYHYHSKPGAIRGTENHSEDFARWSIAPDARRFWSQLSSKLLFTNDILQDRAVRFHIEAVGEGSWAQRVESVELAVARGGLLTPNEGRERLRYPPVEGGDELLSPKGAPDQSDNGDNEPDPKEDEGDDDE